MKDPLLDTVIWLLVAAVLAQIILVFTRGFMCLYWGKACPESEFLAGAEQLSGITATIIALIFAVKGKGPPPP